MNEGWEPQPLHPCTVSPFLRHLSYTVFLLTPGVGFSGVALKVFKPSDLTKRFFMSVSWWVWRDIGAGLSVYLWLWLM